MKVNILTIDTYKDVLFNLTKKENFKNEEDYQNCLDFDNKVKDLFNLIQKEDKSSLDSDRVKELSTEILEDLRSGEQITEELTEEEVFESEIDCYLNSIFALEVLIYLKIFKKTDKYVISNTKYALKNIIRKTKKFKKEKYLIESSILTELIHIDFKKLISLTNLQEQLKDIFIENRLDIGNYSNRFNITQEELDTIELKTLKLIKNQFKKKSKGFN